MRRILGAAIGAVLMSIVPAICKAQVDTRWKIHDMDRALPAVINPGTQRKQDSPGRPPSDAIVLFDGKDLSKWGDKDGRPRKGQGVNGYAEVAAQNGVHCT